MKALSTIGKIAGMGLKVLLCGALLLGHIIMNIVGILVCAIAHD